MYLRIFETFKISILWAHVQLSCIEVFVFEAIHTTRIPRHSTITHNTRHMFKHINIIKPSQRPILNFWKFKISKVIDTYSEKSNGNETTEKNEPKSPSYVLKTRNEQICEARRAIFANYLHLKTWQSEQKTEDRKAELRLHKLSKRAKKARPGGGASYVLKNLGSKIKSACVGRSLIKTVHTRKINMYTIVAMIFKNTCS